MKRFFIVISMLLLVSTYACQSRESDSMVAATNDIDSSNAPAATSYSSTDVASIGELEALISELRTNESLYDMYNVKDITYYYVTDYLPDDVDICSISIKDIYFAMHYNYVNADNSIAADEKDANLIMLVRHIHPDYKLGFQNTVRQHELSSLTADGEYYYSDNGIDQDSTTLRSIYWCEDEQIFQITLPIKEYMKLAGIESLDEEPKNLPHVRRVEMNIEPAAYQSQADPDDAKLSTADGRSKYYEMLRTSGNSAELKEKFLSLFGDEYSIADIAENYTTIFGLAPDEMDEAVLRMLTDDGS